MQLQLQLRYDAIISFGIASSQVAISRRRTVQGNPKRYITKGDIYTTYLCKEILREYSGDYPCTSYIIYTVIYLLLLHNTMGKVRIVMEVVVATM